MKKLIFMFFAIYLLAWSVAKAEENKVTNWLQNEWNEIVTFQQVNWQQGKDQLANNKLQIQNLFQKVKEYVSQD
jgi:hypothetical protein